MMKIQNTTSNADHDVEQKEFLFIMVGMKNFNSYFWRKFD